MQKKLVTVALVGVVLSAALLPVLPAAGEPKTADNRDYDNLAHHVVTRSARIGEGDMVELRGDFKDASLLEALAVQVGKQGGHVLLTARSDRLSRRLFDDVPARFDSREPKLALKLAEIVNARIFIDSADEQALAGVPVERVTAREKASLPLYSLRLKRNVRMVGLGNGLYPTASRARQYGLSEEELARAFWGGLDVDYARLHSTGEQLQKILGNGKELHLTNANGTDLKVKIEKRPVLVSDGNLTPEKIKKGGAALQTWLPAGEVVVLAVADSAAGKVVVDRSFFEGQEVTGLAMTFKAGKLTDLQVKAGGQRLLEMYKAAGAGKEKFSGVDVGINPNVRIPPGSKLVTLVAAGMVSVWTGNDTWAGGDNNAAFGAGFSQPGCTLEVDGKIVIEKGAMKLE
jgi:aminopeptidase